MPPGVQVRVREARVCMLGCVSTYMGVLAKASLVGPGHAKQQHKQQPHLFAHDALGARDMPLGTQRKHRVSSMQGIFVFYYIYLYNGHIYAGEQGLVHAGSSAGAPMTSHLPSY